MFHFKIWISEKKEITTWQI